MSRTSLLRLDLAYGIFLSNQTGNSIFMFVGAVGLFPKARLVDTALSLGSWLLAVLLSGQLGNVFGRVSCAEVQ